MIPLYGRTPACDLRKPLTRRVWRLTNGKTGRVTPNHALLINGQDPIPDGFELYLAPEYQGVGFGTRLFKCVRNDMIDRGIKRIAVWSLSENERARGFYERLGGKVVAETTDRVAGSCLAKVAYLFR